jgi:hypothetical protein
MPCNLHCLFLSPSTLSLHIYYPLYIHITLVLYIGPVLNLAFYHIHIFTCDYIFPPFFRLSVFFSLVCMYIPTTLYHFCYTHSIIVNSCILFLKPANLLHGSRQVNPPNFGETLNGIGAWANEETIPCSGPTALLLPFDNVTKTMLHVFLDESANEQSWSHIPVTAPQRAK